MKLAYKLLLPILLILIVTFSSINFLAIRVLEGVLFEEKAFSLFDHAAKETIESFTDADFQKEVVDEDLSAKLKSFSQAIADPSVFRVKIWDSHWQIVYSDLDQLIGTGRDEDFEYADAFMKDADFHWSVVGSGQGETESGFGQHIDVVIPITNTVGDVKYLVELFVSTSVLTNRIQSTVTQIVYFLIVTGAVFLLAMYLVIHIAVIRRVKFLEKAVNIISQGDLSYEVTSKSGDEIGSLQRNFNNMRIQLKDYTSKLNDSKQQLEQSNKTLTKQGEQLQDQLEQLEKFRQLTVGRELKMIELKKEIADLKNTQKSKLKK